MDKSTRNSVVALASDAEITSTAQHFSSRHSFSKIDLEQCADGLLFGTGNAQLPSNPLLMLDRIVDIQADGGQFERGYAVAELDIDPDKWFFKHHFHGDSLMPGCFLIESLWQLTGFHLAWSGYTGKGRVLESGRSRFIEPITDSRQIVTISVHIRKVIANGNPIYISNGEIWVGDSLKCKSDAIKVGLF